MGENNEKPKTCWGVFPTLLLPSLGALTGFSTILQQQLTYLSSIIPYPSAGSALMGAIGVIGMVYLLFALKSWRSWGIVVVGYLLDFLFTLVLVWPVHKSVGTDPLALWPYVLGTVATLLAGMVVGLMAYGAPLRHTSGIVSIDFLLAGIEGFFLPQALTWTLVSRVVAAYCAAGLGALIGQYARFALTEDRTALGKFLGTTLMSCLTATVAGVLAVLALTYL